MSRCDCAIDPATGLVTETCPRCERAIDRIEDERSGVDFDPSGRMADAAADEHYLGSD